MQAPVPDPELSQVIESYSARFADPVERLKFLRVCAQVTRETPPLLGRAPLGRWRWRLIVLDALRRTNALTTNAIPAKDKVFLLLFRGWRATARYVPLTAAVAALVLLLLGSVMSLRQPASGDEAGAKARPPASGSITPAARAALGEETPHSVSPPLEVWLVETTDEGELYSNGLRILDEYVNHSAPRSFPVFSRGPDGLPADPQRRDQPVGIVFHTTVSDFAPPLERANNQLIRYRGGRLLTYISREHLYNFVIDRFGRVYRTVPESEFCNHAGYSVWSEGGELYFNLNHGFLAVAFESRPEALEPNAPPQEAITAAQVASARLLTQMLREKFGIVEGNCVTHEMVSVNPGTMLIGYHTDWKGRFPFAEVGLPDNYRRTLPSVVDWGFSFDSTFTEDLNGRLWPGLRTAVQQFERDARSRELSVERYRRQQQGKYKEFLIRLREMEAKASDSPPEAAGESRGPA
jgi:hypothetical protein